MMLGELRIVVIHGEFLVIVEGPLGNVYGEKRETLPAALESIAPELTRLVFTYAATAQERS